MSVWKRKAIECLPELKKDFEQPGTSIYDIFMEMLPAVVSAHKTNDTARLQKIYGFAERCFQQKENELWNAAGVAFYEHLGDNEETLKEMSAWVKPTIYTNIRGLLALRLGESEIEKLDQMYGVKPMKY